MRCMYTPNIQTKTQKVFKINYIKYKRQTNKYKQDNEDNKES